MLFTGDESEDVVSRGKRIDHLGAFAVGVPKDIGWAIVELHDDHTVSRTCKGCGVSVRSPIRPNGRVEEAEIHHRDNCAMFDRLGNNPFTS
jgi:hypothetical protein